jgi:8-oxo-dGTP diphosphatase
MGYKVRIRSSAVVIHDGNILLNCFGGGLYYSFPGGGVEEHETSLEAVVREVYEESGLVVEVERHLFTHEYEPCHCGYRGGNQHSFGPFFRCKVIGSTEITPPSVPDTNPDDPTITSHAVWIAVSDLHKTPFVPRTIYRSLMKYIKTGVFEPSFIEETNFEEGWE